MAFMPEREASLAVYEDLQANPAIELGGNATMMIISDENKAGQVREREHLCTNTVTVKKFLPERWISNQIPHSLS